MLGQPKALEKACLEKDLDNEKERLRFSKFFGKVYRLAETCMSMAGSRSTALGGGFRAGKGIPFIYLACLGMVL